MNVRINVSVCVCEVVGIDYSMFSKACNLHIQ